MRWPSLGVSVQQDYLLPADAFDQRNPQLNLEPQVERGHGDKSLPECSRRKCWWNWVSNCELTCECDRLWSHHSIETWWRNQHSHLELVEVCDSFGSIRKLLHLSVAPRRSLLSKLCRHGQRRSFVSIKCFDNSCSNLFFICYRNYLELLSSYRDVALLKALYWRMFPLFKWIVKRSCDQCD